MTYKIVWNDASKIMGMIQTKMEYDKKSNYRKRKWARSKPVVSAYYVLEWADMQ